MNAHALDLTAANGDPIFVPRTVPQILQRAVAECPDNVAIEATGCSISYRQYGTLVEQMARRLVRFGQPGDTVVIVLPNMAATAIAIFAAQSAGRVTATLNPQYTAAELAPMIEDAAPSVAILSSEVAERTAQLWGKDVRIFTVDDDEAFIAELALDSNSDPALPLPQISPESLAVLQFTGGSTGRPKGVELTHRAVAMNVAQREAVLPTQFGDERILGFMPMFHSFAAAMCINLAAYSAGTLVILPRYRPDWVLDAITRHQITRLPAGPTVFNSLTQYDGLTARATQSLRCAYSGSAPLGIETLSRWNAMTSVPIFEGYGQSEAGPILTYFGPSQQVKPGSVGPALPGTHLRIVDPADAGCDLPAGEVGEVLARGPQIMRGYRNLPDETGEALKDGWLHTGDLGMLDSEGVLTIADRKKDMILISGYNVFPREVDEALLTHPDVASAACVGVPDAYRGERLIAFVALRKQAQASEDQLALWLTDRLVPYKQPSKYHLVEELPLTPAGKIDKQALKENWATKPEERGEADRVA
ncbi:MAG: AMP-binding protein [Erythrobacter sp.]|jgi:long-chain acyl-CoA synthetase|nr:AMP-binding protein [Erythrobacter sp.]